MKSITHRAARLLAATWMCLCAGAALAVPVHHVDIDTSTLGTGTAYLGFTFLSVGGATAASASVTNLAADLLGTPVATGSVTGGPPGALAFASDAGGGDWFQAIRLGGHVGFDVSFLFGDGSDGSTFGWSLFDDTHYLGVDGDLGSIALHPDAAPDGRLTVTPDNAFSAVRAVPEPSTLLLVVLAGCVLAAVRRRPV
ncbi:NF038129 family PEP-CTERM protein [Telluria mixta]|uniref:NF038129 family PEP-CTERM protein n=1 Tax=Telluria mixta TaxID=34071 RepID=A0ABT2C445_9BURK|nr:NF038129 family PEP-CTERM protein [Telluria mixta]MCS0632168.1 NF038129 family PEP-CTERM protein [Telluria mixta]WEM95160.1 NF038129 family PEP-CTERM protein [Telluria mixta]